MSRKPTLGLLFFAVLAPAHLLAQSGTALQFYPVTPCRIADTRAAAGFTGSFGPPSLTAYQTRSFNPLSSGCASGIPSNVAAYSLNFTVVPSSSGAPSNLTAWPVSSNNAVPNISTVNYSGSVVANAAIVPAGTGGAINLSVTGNTDVLFDIDGYFAPPASNSYQFHPVTPCRIADTRAPAGFTGQFGPPSMSGGQTRTFYPLSSGCASGIPANVAAYSMNFTVVPPSGGPSANLTTWPAGSGSMPNVSTLNYSGRVVANAAFVPSGTSGGINVFVNYPTDVIVDIDGYFAPPSSGGLNFFTVSPCRIVDPRAAAGFSGTYGPPSMPSNSTRVFAIDSASSPCPLPQLQSPVAYSLNFTVVPPSGGPAAN